MTIKDGFIDKNTTGALQAALKCGFQIKPLKETEKALYVELGCDYGKHKMGIPKSVIENLPAKIILNEGGKE